MSKQRGTRWWPRTPRHLAPGGHVVEDVLVLYVDGELPPRDAAAVSSHLDACWSCRARRDQLDQTIGGFVAYWRRVLEHDDRSGTAARLEFRAALRERLARPSPEPRAASPLARILARIPHPAVSARRWALVPVTLVLLTMAAAIAVFWSGSARASVSAAEVIRRADLRLSDLVKPGQVLYRRWHYRTVMRPVVGEVSQIEGVAEEWAEGSVPNRLARRNRAADGRLMAASWVVPENGALRGFQFRSPATSHWSRNNSRLGAPTVFVTPTNEELQREIARFPEPERRALQLLLSVDPLAGDRAWYSLATSVGKLVGHEMKAEPATLSDGRAGLRLFLVMPSGMLWNYNDEGVAFMPASWRATYLFAVDSGLLQETEREWRTEDGCLLTTAFKVEVLRVQPASACADVFAFPLPDKTRTVSVHAAELVRSMRDTLLRPDGAGRKSPW